MQVDKTERKNLGESLIESFGKSSLAEIVKEASEIALDSTLDDGLWKEIPILGWLFKGHSAYCSITDKIFLKKVALFLYGVSKASANEREKFKNDLNDNPEFRKKVGENLLLLIDRHERLEKSYLLGKLMAKVIQEECSSELFLKIAAALDRSTAEDLEDLRKYSQNIEDLPESSQQSLYKSNLLDMDINTNVLSGPFSGPVTPPPSVNVWVGYKLNALGEKMIGYVLSDDS